MFEDLDWEDPRPAGEVEDPAERSARELLRDSSIVIVNRYIFQDNWKFKMKIDIFIGLRTAQSGILNLRA